MKYAILTSLGGELIDAADAKYSDYIERFLDCPICSEAVFLRKASKRNGKPVRAAFIHRKGGGDICELRVKAYSLEDVQKLASESRGQWLEKLKKKMWNYLTTTAIVNMNQWSKMVKEVKEIQFYANLAKNAQKILHLQNERACNRIDEFSRVFKKNSNSVIKIQSQAVKKFLKQRKRDWALHLKITKETFKLFVKSPQLLDIQERIACFLCHPEVLKLEPQLWHLDVDQKEWQKEFLEYIEARLIMIFLTVDWIKLFELDSKESNNSQSRDKRSKKIYKKELKVRMINGKKKICPHLKEL